MIAEVREAVGALEVAVGALSPGRLDGDDAARLVKVLAKGEHLCATGKARVARRVDETRVWQASGQPSAAAFLAATTGTSLGQAIGTLQTAERLEELPATAEAFQAGELSEVQAREIAGAAIVDPSAEEELLRAAATNDVKGLKDLVARVKTAAVGVDEQRRRVHATRFYRRWRDADGGARGEFRLTTDAAMRLDAVMRAETERIYREARSAGQRESHDAYAADALVAIADRAVAGGGGGGDDGGSGPAATILARVDVAAIRNGRAGSGDVCEIAGVGTVPVAVARDLLGDACLKIVLTDGVDVRNVTHLGRHRPAAINTALHWIYGGECGVAGCHRTRNLEVHHTVDYAETRHTRLDELVPLCGGRGGDHDLVTHHGHTLRKRPDGQYDRLPPGAGDDDERGPP